MMSQEIYCSKCGVKNPIENDFCTDCGFVLRKIIDFQEVKEINSREEIFTKEHENMLNVSNFKTETYTLIFEVIYEIGKKEINHKTAGNLLQKITNIVESYASWSYKSRGAELGFYVANTIKLDDRLDTSNQIATLIHELSHHIFAELYEQMLMYLWNVKKTVDLEVFVNLVLGSPILSIANEYCAHTVEGRFIPHGYQNYGSFNRLINEYSHFDKEEIILALTFGNTIAEDIINILDKFIGPEIREEIKQQYKMDAVPRLYDQIILESKETLTPEVRNEFLIISFIESFKNIKNNREMVKIYDQIKSMFLNPDAI